jgi:hypothetical protein
MVSAGTKIPIHYEDVGAMMGGETKTIELFRDQIKGCRVDRKSVV